MAQDKCPRLGKWFGGCKFEPRYSEDAARIPNNATRLSEDSVRSFRNKKYECDVCIR